MSDAKATIRQSILMGMTDGFGMTEETVDNIIKRLFSSAAIWSIEEYLEELSENT